jgi:hypothetical protein
MRWRRSAAQRSAQAGNGRGNRCESEDELLQSLDSDGGFMTLPTWPLRCPDREGSLLGHPWQLIRARLEWQSSRFDPHPPSRPLVLRYVRPF